MTDPAARRSRERELASLYATARSLTALGDVDDVLGSIVRHAFDLIGTGITYLSLLDPDGSLAITASQGTISARFRAARIGPGTGLGGKVIVTRTAHWVEDYASATELTHDPSFDDLLSDEGMAALLGVPLLVRGEVLGVLFAADRSKRRFRTDEIALLTAFADHAAVALDNARLYERSRDSLDRLREAYGTIEAQVAQMERAQAVHEALTGAVLAGGGPQVVASELADQMGGGVIIVDREGVLLAEAGERGHDQSSSMSIRAGDSVLGTLAWTHVGEIGDADIRSLELAAHVVGLLMLKENAAADAAVRLSGELLTELILAGPQMDAAQRFRARARGIDLSALDVLVTVECEDMTASNLVRHLGVLAGENSGLAGEHLGRATLLAAAPDDDDLESFAQSLHRRLRSELGRPAIVIAERVRANDWSRAFGLATGCLSVARQVGATDLGASTDRFALYALVFDGERRGELDRFLHDTLGPLLRYDQQRSTDLVATLTAYFAHDGNLRRTARALHVHLNTLLKRLDRITTVFGHDWRTVDDLQLRLAVRLHELRTPSTL
ncbi:helix-turn-helix domain-containing protein [Aeromicrobium sp. CF3.5]|uniref:helix-turn-helix domain-containing protein n=1 Tax=Aeromicrobium sp. CF3.5 TaxID=3373078 RepID=UPI003EE4BA33